MSDTDKNNGNPIGSHLDALPKLAPPYTRSKQEVWEAVQDTISQKTTRKRISFASWSVAASVVLLISASLFLRLNSTIIHTGIGEQMAVVLPDGSEVQMNENSHLSYKPYWWRFERELSLDGEAYFKVEKGERFTVVSSKGQTQVLGTSFNIYARGIDYEVTCLTGKVRVSGVLNEQHIDILPQQKVSVNTKGNLYKQDLSDLSQSVSWTQESFLFNATPIAEVWNTIERHYGIKVMAADSLDLNYSGKFSRDLTVEEVVNIVCRSFGLSFDKEGKDFIITKK